MKDNRLLLLHGINSACGCNAGKLGGQTMAYKRKYNKTTRKYAKRRVSRKRGLFSGTGRTGAFDPKKYLPAQIAANFDAVKSVAITGLIAAGGAIITRKLFDALAASEMGKSLKLEKGTMAESLAMVAFGLGGGLLILKFLKKPTIGTAFAIGPIVVAGMNILGDVLKPTDGLGYIEASREGFRPGQMALGASRVVPEGFQPQVIPMVDQAYGSY